MGGKYFGLVVACLLKTLGGLVMQIERLQVTAESDH